MTHTPPLSPDVALYTTAISLGLTTIDIVKLLSDCTRRFDLLFYISAPTFSRLVTVSELSEWRARHFP